jgi:hypothetical protein
MGRPVDDNDFDRYEAEAREEAAAYEEWMESMHCASATRSLPLILADPWIRACPRTSEEIEAAFCLEQIIGGMPHGAERGYLHSVLSEAGYLPSGDTENPAWAWSEGN